MGRAREGRITLRPPGNHKHGFLAHGRITLVRTEQSMYSVARLLYYSHKGLRKLAFLRGTWSMQIYFVLGVYFVYEGKGELCWTGRLFLSQALTLQSAECRAKKKKKKNSWTVGQGRILYYSESTLSIDCGT